VASAQVRARADDFADPLGKEQGLMSRTGTDLCNRLAFELRVPLPDVVAMRTRQPNLEGAGEIPLRPWSARQANYGQPTERMRSWALRWTAVMVRICTSE
jgi:hypothetical protein